MDKRVKQRLLTMYSNGLNAEDITKDITTRHSLDPRAEYAATLLEVEQVLKQQGVKDPSHRIPQKPEIQPDMPKRFIPITSATTRKKLTYKPKPTKEQKEWHAIACGVSQNGRKLLKSPDRHTLERQIVEHLERGFVQLGGISTDFYCDGEMFFAVVKKGDFS